mgnify:CR=1 FL=1
MTSVLNVDTIADKAGTGPVELTKQQAAKAWTHFTCVSSTTIRDSFNTSSLTDLTTGSTRATFTSAMGNNDYAATGYSNFDATTGEGAFDADISGRGFGLVGRATTTIQHYSYTIDSAVNDIQIIGDLA